MAPPQLPRIEELEYWSSGEKARLASKGNAGVAETVTISAELYERLAQVSQTQTAAPVEAEAPKKFANPTPLGLFGLFITTMSFSVIEMGWGMGAQIGQLNGIVGSLFFTGPVLLLFASFAEWIVGNFFAFIVSGTLGVLWLSIGVLFVPSLGIVASYSPTGDIAEGLASEGFNTALGVYLIGWSLATFVLLICTLKTNIAFVITFAILDAGLFIGAASHFRMPIDPVTGLVLQKVAAGCTLVVSFLVFYLLCVTMFDEMGVAIHLPVGDLSAKAPPKLELGYPHMHDHSNHGHAHAHHHHHHQHHDEEAQWGPRISLPMQR